MVDENGIDPVAGDGEPFEAGADNELENRRKLAEARARAEEEGTGMTGKKRGAPIDDQPDADEPEMFPLGTLSGDPKVTHKTMIKPGSTVKYEAKLSNASVPMTDGLIPAGTKTEILVTIEAGAFKPTPEFGEEEASDGTRKVKAWKIVQNHRAVHVRTAERMFTLDQVLEILEEKFGIARTDPQIAEVFGADAVAA